MRRLILMTAAVVGCLAGSLPGRAAYLEQDTDVVAPRRPRSNPLMAAVRRLSVRPGHTYKGLTVYTLETSVVLDGTDYRSLSEALVHKELIIIEKPSASVPAVLAENRGGRSVLLLAGEIISGGRQNRTLRDDVLLPPHSGPIELPVLCVERGRWSGPRSAFEKGSSIAALEVRAGASSGQSQDKVWDSVSSYGKALKAPSATSDLQAVQDAPETRRAVDDYRKGFAGCWRPRTVGMVVARHGRIVGADIFCNPAVFAKHRDRLLESYAVDCYAYRLRDGPRKVPIIAPEDPERFLARVYRARFEWRETPGEGRILAVSRTVGGHALVLGDAVLHAGLFPPEPPVIRPLPEPPQPGPIPLPRLELR